MNKQYDVAVIGGGSGGYAAAIRVAQYGQKVAQIEEKDMGGTCLNRGCIPTKSLLQSAETYDHAKHSADFGVDIRGISYDFEKIMKRKTQVTGKLRAGIEFLVKNAGVEIIRGRGALVDKQTIEVTGETAILISAQK